MRTLEQLERDARLIEHDWAAVEVRRHAVAAQKQQLMSQPTLDATATLQCLEDKSAFIIARTKRLHAQISARRALLVERANQLKRD